MGPDVWGRARSWGSHLPYFIGPTASIGLVTPCLQWFIRPALSLATATCTPPRATLSPHSHFILTRYLPYIWSDLHKQPFLPPSTPYPWQEWFCHSFRS